ncbi:MAG: hypothetical protein ABR880_12695 [Candidatus Sulfotelmatobacter sp.]|jgi:hypothetical protein
MQSTRLWRAVVAVLVVVGTSGQAVPQQAASDRAASTAVVTFALDFPQSQPTHYSIAVDANGHATYECAVKAEEDSDEQTYRTEFEMTAANRDRIFAWAKEAKYFSGALDSGNRKLAFTGAKILSYQDGLRSATARYNYSNLEPVRQLTTLFQNVAGTLDYGRRLTYYHRYQKLGLDEELKRMEEQAKNNELSEIQGVAPVLQGIVEDSSVINVVRARARELIQMASSTPGGRQ